MTYCTEEQARRAGASGSQADVLAAIASAASRIDRFTGDHFEPEVGDVTRTCRVTGTGLVVAPYVRSVTSITLDAPYATTLPSTAWRLNADGEVRVLAGYASGSDALIVGAEPWNGGWANLIGPDAPSQVVLVGKCGWDAPPSEVAQAAAILAALIAPAPYTAQADAEGNPAGVPTGLDPASVQGPRKERVLAANRLERTTGSAEADRLLAPLRAVWRVS